MWNTLERLKITMRKILATKGDSGDDSTVRPPSTLTVLDAKIILFNSADQPMVRKIGFRKDSE